MTTTTMHESHDPCATAPARPWLWTLAPSAARRLPRAEHGRWLVVECGRVWLTRSETALQPGDDVWLAAGDRHWLPAGSEWVAEGWPEARWAVMEAPQAAPSRQAWSGAGWLLDLQRRFSRGALPA